MCRKRSMKRWLVLRKASSALIVRKRAKLTKAKSTSPSSASIRFRDRPFHAHNRLIASAALNGAERRETAREMSRRLGTATAPVHLLLPLHGIEEWDRPGEPAHDPAALAEFFAELRDTLPASVQRTELDCHINDPAFADAALAVLDHWIAGGVVGRP